MRQLPHDKQAEEQVLKNYLCFPEDRQFILKNLNPTDFYVEKHQQLFEAIVELNGTADIHEINQLLKGIARDATNNQKWLLFIDQIFNGPGAINLKDDIDKIRDAADRREYIIRLSDLSMKAYNGELPLEETKRAVCQLERPDPTIDRPDPLQFPYKIMSGAAGYFASVYGEILEAPEQFLFMGYLTALGAVLSPRLTIDSALQTKPRLFTILVGESATDRKSTTLNTVTSHFRSVMGLDFKMCWGIGSAEGLNKILNAEGNHSNGVLLAFDELKSFVSKCNIDTSILLPAINTLFESNRFESHTKKHSIQIDNAHVSMLAATTMQNYERIYNSSFLDIGFTNRTFLVTGTAKRRFSIPMKVDEDQAEKMREQLVEIMQHVSNGLELEIEPEAKAFYHNWYLSQDGSVHAKRLDTYSLRIMQLLTVNNLKKIIDIEAVKGATLLCDWQLAIRKLHDPIDADSNIAKMEERIRRVLKHNSLNDRDLKRKSNAYRTGLWVYNSALKNLRGAGEVKFEKRGKKYFLS